ncbi:hypothetical protein BJY54_006259 [Streptomyces nodosus]|nr:hypothetical protein [Streptomyces nodosus]
MARLTRPRASVGAARHDGITGPAPCTRHGVHGAVPRGTRFRAEEDGSLMSPAAVPAGFVRQTGKSPERVGGPPSAESRRVAGSDADFGWNSRPAPRPKRHRGCRSWPAARRANPPCPTPLCPLSQVHRTHSFHRDHTSRTHPTRTCYRTVERKLDHSMACRGECVGVENQPAARLSYAERFPLDRCCGIGVKSSREGEARSLLDGLRDWAFVGPGGAVVTRVRRPSSFPAWGVDRETSDTELSGRGDPRRPGF